MNDPGSAVRLRAARAAIIYGIQVCRLDQGQDPGRERYPPKSGRGYPDPCEPDPGREHLEREWRIRKLTLTELGRISPAECPARIISGCSLNDDESKFIAASWLAESDERGRSQ